MSYLFDLILFALILFLIRRCDKLHKRTKDLQHEQLLLIKRVDGLGTTNLLTVNRDELEELAKKHPEQLKGALVDILKEQANGIL